MNNPGKKSLIISIHILKNKNKYFKNNKFKVYTKKIKSTPLIENYIFFKEYKIKFVSAIRPSMDIKKIPKPSNKLINEIKKIKKNVLIIGASSGLGFELMKLYKHNKKIKIFASYYKNTINQSSDNLKKIRLNVEEDMQKIKDIIKRNQPINIYYFSTPKINLLSKDQLLKKKYKNYYYNYPLQIIKMLSCKENGFFYPSSVLAGESNSYYAKYKLMAEIFIHKIKKNNNTDLRVFKLPYLKTKQNITIIKNNYPLFTNFLEKNKKCLNAVLFK